jgi:hypothetical protein
MTVPDVDETSMGKTISINPPVVWLRPFSTLHFYGREDEILGGHGHLTPRNAAI